MLLGTLSLGACGEGFSSRFSGETTEFSDVSEADALDRATSAAHAEATRFCTNGADVNVRSHRCWQDAFGFTCEVEWRARCEFERTGEVW